VYHELLHAQLGIDALGAAIIVNPVCQCAGPNPASQSDKGHTVIPGLQDGYVISAGAANGVNVQVVRIQVPATGNAFALQIPVAKPKYSIQAVQTSNGNVASIHVGDRGDDGKVPVTGTLEDPAQGGSVIIMIDPPVSWEYLYVELVPAPTPAQRRSWGEIKQIYR
jgi:hypothetical protein